MKVKIALLIVIAALNGRALFAAEPELSGTLNSTINYSVLPNSPYHSFGLEEYANLRLRVRPGDRISFYAALDAVVISGNYLGVAAWTADGYGTRDSGVNATPFVYGANFAAAIEPERLYFRVSGDYIDVEAGLLRLNFGYGQVWGSSDFLNPRNPLSQNARPRGVLGLDFSFYPTDTMKLLFFAVSPKNPLESTGGGFIPGVSMDKHWDYASLQLLYSYETPLQDAAYGVHRFGLSFKGDLELGIVVDGLYTLNAARLSGVEGLSLGAGFDYSFLGGDLYILCEYLYNGTESATSDGAGGSMMNHHYLSGSIMYRINDFASLGFSSVYCFDDPSFLHSLFLDYEVYQGFSLSLNTRLPMDIRTGGELGPAAANSRFNANISAKLRF